MAGPLQGVRIVELAGIGPGPFCGMMLADHGAEVIRVERVGAGTGLSGPIEKDVLARSRKSIALNMKDPAGVALFRDLARSAEGLIEGFRPGVMERLGLGPEVLLADNPKLVYGRMTGWGQTGPYANAAGHDINYIALAGALHAYGRADEKPTPPINMIGDFGGGGMMLAFGMVSAILHARATGEGQVIDCAMTEGAAVLMSMIWGMRGMGVWRDERGVNLLDTGAPFYDTYETADGKFISIGSLEPQFYSLLCKLLCVSDDPDFDAHMNPQSWAAIRAKLTPLFKTKTRDEWCELMAATDVCYAPVLTMSEAPEHPHNKARGAFIELNGVTQPTPAPRYSVTQSTTPKMAGKPGADSTALLAELGYDGARIAALRDAGVIE